MTATSASPRHRSDSRPVEIDAGTQRRLRVFNLAMGAVHLVQGVVIVLLSTDFTLPITASFSKTRPGVGGPQPPEVLLDVRIGLVVAAFLFISAFFHFLVAAPRVFDRYIGQLRHQMNLFRWAEYAVSASLMIVVIAMLPGIYDVVALLGLFAVNATMILFGWLMEKHQTPQDTDWTAFWFGTFAGAVPWIGIGIYLIGAGGGVPGFVYAIFVSLFIVFNVFAVNQVLQYRQAGPWRNYVFGEVGYIVLSLTAKSALAWQVFAGTLQ